VSAELGVIGMGVGVWRRPDAAAEFGSRPHRPRPFPRDLLLLVRASAVITLGRGFQGETCRLRRSFSPQARRGARDLSAAAMSRIRARAAGGLSDSDLTEHRQDLHWYLRQIEAAALHTLDAFGLVG